MIEILAPAGDSQSVYAAVNSGADAVYLGLTSFSARSSAENFDMPALQKLIARAHVLGVKIYVAMNTLVKESELEKFVSTAVEVWNIGADAIIIQDLYLGAYLKKTYPKMCLHLSTQAGVCNALGARYAKSLGFSRVILARETPLEDIAEIAEIIETEVFVQGALCTAFSGQCYFSSFAGGNSGNRGRCKQPCRKRYSIDRKGFIDPKYRISLSDLSVGEDIQKLVEAGVSSFKIEGRMRRPEYVSAAVRYYKNLLSGNNSKGDLSALKRTYNRGNYTKGLAFGQDKSFISSSVQGHIGEYVGVVSVISGKYVCLSYERCGVGDGFKILRGGVEVGGASFGGACKGGFYLDCKVRLRAGDKVFITTDCSLNQALATANRVLPVTVGALVKVGERVRLTICGEEYFSPFTAQAAKGCPVSAEDIKNCFSKVGDYPFEVSFGEVTVEGGAFVPLSQMNAFRRVAYEKFASKISGREVEKLEFVPLPKSQNNSVKNNAVCVIAGNLKGVKADIGVLKPNAYSGDLQELCSGFTGEKFLYLPPFLTGREIEGLKPLITAFDGIYCGGNYAVPLAKEMNKKLFAGTGFNLSNSISIGACPADYKAISKELTAAEARLLVGENTFYLTAGDIKLMDLCYCPFGKTCAECDKRDLYTLTDENGRKFPLRRTEISSCRFEVFNCASLVAPNNFTGVLAELTLCADAARLSQEIQNTDKLKKSFVNHTGGHWENPVL